MGLWAGLKVIYSRMSPPARHQLFLVLLLMLAGAVAELATVGAVIPFLALLAGTAGPFHARALPALFPSADPLMVAAAMFIVLALLAGAVRLLLARSTRSFIFRLGHELSVEIQRRVLRQPLSFHVHRNTSAFLTALNKAETLVYDVLLPLMQAVTGGVLASFIMLLLLFVAPFTTLAVAAAFALTYGLISAAVRKPLAAISAVIDTAYDARLQVIQESLGGIRDVIVDNSQSTYLTTFESIDSDLARARALNHFITLAPRYAVETVGMILIAAVALIFASRTGGITAALPVLGALALGAQKLLPLVQEVYSGWSKLEGQRSIFAQIIELLCLPEGERVSGAVTPLEFRREIVLEEVSFSYPGRELRAVNRVSLAIPHGRMIALVGATGSGKSTLLDVLMGLLEPDAGRILIDERMLDRATIPRWHRSIAHVPQTIFLADTTIARNIAISISDVPPDRSRILDAAKKAQLHDFVVSLPDGYETLVGERGVRLSGGQRQRLGLARAIYKGAPVMVLDEATSALDDETEAAVIAALDALRGEGRTIVLVAHRLSTVRRCDLVAKLDHGRVVQVGTFQEVFTAHEQPSL